jgi:phosphate transport system substrate-binding protein
MSRAALCALLIFTITTSLIAKNSNATRGVVRLTGSETMKEYGQRLTEWYAKKSPGIQFAVSAGRADESFASMVTGKTDIVQSERRVLHSETQALHTAQGKDYLELQVATQIAGIVVNTRNPVKELSLFQLRQVLSGSVKNWKQVGGEDAAIVIYGCGGNSGVRAFLEEEFMGDEGISDSAKSFPTNSGMLNAVSHDVNGIGFGTVEERAEAKVRFVAIKPSANAEGVAPSGEAVRAKRYKLVRPLYFYFAGAPEAELLQFARWILSPEGQLVVESVGYYPLSGAEREEGLKALK